MSVESPKPDALVHGMAHITVLVPHGTHKVALRVGSHDASRYLHGSGTSRTAIIPTRFLRPGRVTIAVRALATHGGHLFAHSTMIVAQREPRLLVHTPTTIRSGGTVFVSMTLRQRPSSFRVTLNGHQVHLLHQPTAGTLALPLAADDGLKYGKNRLNVSAVSDRTGAWANRTIRFKIGKRTPLVSAGQDIAIKAGAPVSLTAGGTRWPGSEPAGVSYQWHIASQPQVSHLSLSNAVTRQVSLRPREPGRYRLAVAIKLHGKTLGTDTVTVEAAANLTPYGSAFTTLVPNSDGSTRTTITGVPLNARGEDYLDLPASFIQLIVLNQSTLAYDPTLTRQYGQGDLPDLLKTLKNLPAGDIGILEAAPGSWPNSTPVWGANLTSGFTAIFTAGSTQPYLTNFGAAATVASSGQPGLGGAINALIRPTLGGFAVAYPDALTFDSRITDTSITHGAGFNMQLGNQNFNISGAPAGVALVSVDADLRTGLGHHYWYLNGTSSDAGSLEDLAATLTQIATAHPGSVTMLQTWGDPKPITTAWGDVGNALGRFGGTSSVWDSLDGTGDYALIGRAGAGNTTTLQATASAEESAPQTSGTDSPQAKNTAGTVRGALTRGLDSLPILAGSTSMPVPSSKDANGNTYLPNPYDLFSLAQADPQPWPAMTGNEPAAYAWVSQQLDLGDPGVPSPGSCYQPTSWDVRSAYCNTTLAGEWSSSKLDSLNGITCPTTNNAFSQIDCQNVVAQLKLEFPKIAPVVSMFDNLQKPFDSAQAAAAIDVADAASAVDDSLSVTPPTPTFGLQEFLSDFFQPVQDLSEPEDSDGGFVFGVGLFASALDMALSLTGTDDGNPALAQFDSTKATIGQDTIGRFTAASGQMAVMENMILTDWTKLSTTSYNAEGIWGSNGLTTAEQTVVVETNTKAWLYETMVPLAYSQVAVAPKAGLTLAGVNAYSCTYGNYPYEYTRWPFQPSAIPDFHGDPVGGTPMPASAVFAPTNGTNDDGTATSTFIWALGNATGDESFQTPSSTLTDPLFDPPIDQNGDPTTGVGLHPAQFYTWAWLSQNRYSINSFIGQSGLDYAYDCH